MCSYGFPSLSVNRVGSECRQKPRAESIRIRSIGFSVHHRQISAFGRSAESTSRSTNIYVIHVTYKQGLTSSVVSVIMRPKSEHRVRKSFTCGRDWLGNENLLAPIARQASFACLPCWGHYLCVAQTKSIIDQAAVPCL